MPAESSADYSFLRQLDLFSDLSNQELNKALKQFAPLSLPAGAPLFSGRLPQDNFYIITKGKLSLSHGKPDNGPQSYSAGEFFNETAAFFGQPKQATLISSEPTTLLKLASDEFAQLISDFPSIKPHLARTEESQRIASQKNFDWLGKDEVVYYISRKHEVILLLNLIGPFLIYLIGLILVFGVANSQASQTIWAVAVAVAGILGGTALLWGIWNWVNWGNDFFILTNQRVVWIEKVVWLYESRDEAPLGTILSVEVSSYLIGRLFHFGNIQIRTFTGEILFRNLKQPHLMADLIEEYRILYQRGAERQEAKKVEQAIQQRLSGETVTPIESSAASTNEELSSSSNFLSWFANFFAVRFQQGELITYRKYWPTLLGKVFWPTFLSLLDFIVIIGLIRAWQKQSIESDFVRTIVLLLFLFWLFVLIPWWIYRYIDWYNDIYQVSNKYIFDIERKPLGTEVKKSAALENILSLEHKRVGLLGYLLNFGNVTINVGEARFVFFNVHDPARVQQDIFNRLYSLRQQNELTEADQQRQRLVDAIEIYHKQTSESQNNQDSLSNPDNIGVK